MSLTIGDTAPDFEADTTEARSASTTGSATAGPCCSRTRATSRPSARPSSATWRSIKPEFDKRGAKIIGLSVDPVEQPREVGRRTSPRPRAPRRTTR